MENQWVDQFTRRLNLPRSPLQVILRCSYGLDNQLSPALGLFVLQHFLNPPTTDHATRLPCMRAQEPTSVATKQASCMHADTVTKSVACMHVDTPSAHCCYTKEPMISVADRLSTPTPTQRVIKVQSQQPSDGCHCFNAMHV